MRLAEHIDLINKRNEKALSVFLTAGFPERSGFSDIACSILDSGADLLELGIPFSDPLADGPIIQYSSQAAIENKVNIKTVFQYSSEIKFKANKPVILMGYANPILNYGTKNFFNDAVNSGADGVIIPDVPLDEYESFFSCKNSDLDSIILTTPFSTEKRIKRADGLSSGFIYCVSVNGTTGERTGFSPETIEALSKTRSIITKNKMLIGFGISSAESIRSISPVCDGVIVGSAIIKRLIEYRNKNSFSPLYKYITELKEACREAKK